LLSGEPINYLTNQPTDSYRYNQLTNQPTANIQQSIDNDSFSVI